MTMDLHDYPYDLGAFVFDITTEVPEAQEWMRRGMLWTFGFHHHEAIACFEAAAKADPECAMAFWGIAYAVGPNYNLTWDLFDAAGRAEALARAYDATQQAIARLSGVSAAEHALITALQDRYPQRDCDPDMEAWNDRFAQTMRRASLAHPQNNDLRAITVEAMMLRTPWKMWDLVSGLPADDADTLHCQQMLEDAFASNAEAWAHPGLLHLYVHLMEMSPTPERALPQGDALRRLVPDAGHLVHMPTHIDVQCGAYHDVVFWNERAVEADLKYYDRAGAFNLYTGYRQHNYHFVMYGAMMLGQLAPALRAAKGMTDTTPEDLLRIQSPPMADFFEAYLAFYPHILVRFGRWGEAVALPLPQDPVLYCTMTAHVRYARAVAQAALGQVDAALDEEAAFLAAADAVPEERRLHNNTVRDLLEVAKAMVRGEILYRQGAHDAAFDALRAAVRLEDGLAYDEPWGWMQPSRHALGALLFEQGRIAEAEQAFREDLGLMPGPPRAQVHPDNVWALRGLHDCLVARGAKTELAHIKPRLERALARADRAVAAACFCAQSAMACCDREGE